MDAVSSKPTPAAPTPQRLLDATHELLCERAGGNVSVSELCARAGANVAMVKYYFGSKDALLDALLERIIASLLDDLRRLDDEDLDPAAKLRLHIRAVVRNYVRYPYLNRLLNDRIAAGPEEQAARLIRLFALPAREWYARVLADGAAAGAFRECDPSFFFFSLLGAAEFMFSGRRWMERAFETEIDDELLERFIEHTTTLILSGVERR